METETGDEKPASAVACACSSCASVQSACCWRLSGATLVLVAAHAAGRWGDFILGDAPRSNRQVFVARSVALTARQLTGACTAGGPLPYLPGAAGRPLRKGSSFRSSVVALAAGGSSSGLLSRCTGRSARCALQAALVDRRAALLRTAAGEQPAWAPASPVLGVSVAPVLLRCLLGRFHLKF